MITRGHAMDKDDEFKINTSSDDQDALLNVKVDGKSVLEVLTPSYKLLFNTLMDFREVVFDSLFDEKPFKTTEGIFVDAKGTILKYNDYYNKAELEQPLRRVSFGSTAAEKNIYTTSVASIQKNALKEMIDKDLYLTFSNLFYRDVGNNLLSSPLVFIKVKLYEKEGVYYLKALTDGPIFNEELIRRIKERFDIDISYNRYDFDLYEYISFASGKVANLLWGVDETSYLSDFDIFESNRLARLKELDTRLLSVKAINSIRVKKEMIDEGRLDRSVDKNIDENGIAAISVTSKEQQKYLFEKYLVRELKAGKKVLIVDGKDDVEEFIKHYKLQFAYNPYTPTSNSVSLFDAFNRIGKYKYTIKEDLDTYDEVTTAYNEFRMLEEEKLEVVSPTGESLYDIINEIISLNDKISHPLEIDLAEDYDENDFASDKEFLDSLSNLKDLRNSIVIDNPFYGLEASKDKTTYDNLIKIVDETCFDLLQFFSAVKELNENSHGFVKIEKLRDYDEYISHFELFVRYDGFPLRYFEFDNDERLLAILSSAKNAYSIAGSLKLSIENLTSATFFSKITTELYEKAAGKNRKAKKELKSFLKVKDKKNYISLLTLLGNYYENDKHIVSYFNELKNGYNITVSTIDDIINVESALAYIDDYTRYVKLYDETVDFNSEFVKELFNDTDKRLTFKNVILPKLEAMRYKIDADIDEYHEFNPHDYTDYTDITYEDLKQEFENKRRGTYEEFASYSEFSQKLKEASRHLKDFLNEYIKLEVPMSTFASDYIYSLDVAIYNNYIRGRLGYNQWNECAQKYIKGLSVGQEAMKANDLLVMVSELKEKSRRSEINHVLDEIKHLTRSTRVLNTPFMVSRYMNTLTDYYPITYVSSKEVFIYHNVKFDTIIINNANISGGALAHAIGLGHETIIFQDSDYPFNKPISTNLKDISGGVIFDEIKFSLEKLFDGVKLSYDIKLNKEYKNNIIPVSLVLHGSKDVSFVLLPDIIYLKDDEYFETYIEFLPEYINNVLKITPIMINTIELATAKDKSVYLRNIISGVLESKLTFTKVEEINKKEVTKSGNKEKYLKRLTDINNSFESFPLLDEIDELLEKKDYEKVFELVSPINATKLMAYGNDFAQYVLDKVKEGVIVLRKDHFYIGPNLRIKVRKSLPSQRQMEDISIDEVLRAIYVYLSNFSYMTYGALVNELVHLYGIYDDDPIFKSRMQRALVVLISKGYIVKNNNKYSLVR